MLPSNQRALESVQKNKKPKNMKISLNLQYFETSLNSFQKLTKNFYAFYLTLVKISTSLPYPAHHAKCSDLDLKNFDSISKKYSMSQTVVYFIRANYEKKKLNLAGRVPTSNLK